MQTKLLSNCAEMKFSTSESGITYIKGYASVFGGVDSYGDTIEKGAYAKTLEKLFEGGKRRIHMRWNHFGEVIGKWTLLKEDERGLYVEGELTPGHSIADNAAASLKHGAIDGLSIGYIVKEEEMEGPIRNLKEIDLIEISVVEEPADNAARVASIKSDLAECEQLKDIESVIRAQFKLSRTETTAIVGAVKRVIHCDNEIDENQLSAVFDNFKQSI